MINKFEKRNVIERETFCLNKRNSKRGFLQHVISQNWQRLFTHKRSIPVSQEGVKCWPNSVWNTFGLEAHTSTSCKEFIVKMNSGNFLLFPFMRNILWTCARILENPLIPWNYLCWEKFLSFFFRFSKKDFLPLCLIVIYVNSLVKSKVSERLRGNFSFHKKYSFAPMQMFRKFWLNFYKRVPWEFLFHIVNVQSDFPIFS